MFQVNYFFYNKDANYQTDIYFLTGFEIYTSFDTIYHQEFVSRIILIQALK